MPVICWYCDVRPLSAPSLFSRGMALLPWAERREKVMRFRFEKDRCLCLGAGLLLAYALRQAGAKDLSLRRLSNGKPALANEPRIHFNLSHGGAMAVCAVSDHPVGADVEPLQEPDAGIVTMCFQPSERAWVDEADVPARAFTRLWTRKESYLKMLGTGLYRSMDSFSALPGEEMPDDAVFTEREEMGHLICVCAHRSEAVIFREGPLVMGCR